MADMLKDWARYLKRDAHAVYLAARDRRTPWYAKALAICVAGYALSPIDLALLRSSAFPVVNSKPVLCVNRCLIGFLVRCTSGPTAERPRRRCDRPSFRGIRG
jgi:hypothetical protein